MKKKLRRAGKLFIIPQLFVVTTVLACVTFGLYCLRSGAVQGLELPKDQAVNGLMAIFPKYTAPPPALPPPPRADCSMQICLALTFDDGPTPAITPHVLDVLEKHGVRATFFVVGSRVPGHEALLRRMN